MYVDDLESNVQLMTFHILNGPSRDEFTVMVSLIG